MTSCDLPEDVVFHILSWLPVKSLTRFKCVCKSWCGLVKNSSFISKHLHHSAMGSNNNGGLLGKNCDYGPLTFSLLSGETLAVLGNVDTPAYFIENEGRYKYQLEQEMMSCNGIICVCSKRRGINSNLDVTLWNPATREIKHLPKSSLAHYGRHSLYQFGFGFDVKTNDYKVLRSVADCREDCTTWQVEIYSVSRGSCRVISAFLPTIREVWDSHLGLYWNGSCYWLSRPFDTDTIYDNLLWFDMSDEIFQTRPLPAACSYKVFRKNITKDFNYIRSLEVINDSVAVVLFSPVDSESWLTSKDGILNIETWVLKECWTQLYKVELTPHFHGWPLRVHIDRPQFQVRIERRQLQVRIEERHLIFRRNNDQIDLVCDLATLEKKSGKEKFMQMVTYHESLVSLEETK